MTIGPSHPGIDGITVMIVIPHMNESVSSRERINHLNVDITLGYLKWNIVVGVTRDAEHVAFCFIVRLGPLGAVFVALLERFCRIRDRAPAANQTFPRRNRGDCSKLPESGKA